ncbi:MAG: hypothetical protein AAF656_08720 [Planctomycetota bacterium]
MPVYHFTIHAYASWMPDRPEGFYHYRHGYQPADENLDFLYRDRQRQPRPTFDEQHQKSLIESLLETFPFKRVDGYAIATDPTHVHTVCGWRDERTGETLRERLKHAMSLRLNKEFEHRTWFSRGGDITKIENDEHLAHVCDVYLPDHVGWKWDRYRGWYR